ncbi:hypothetical protein CJF30_00006904 [Rutstroemia sp. NJR-2017a BBW]|nr:hypothetical protein CJF30_00006904 [Rutstroemia sp. NJR-2017a BBW]
MSANTTDTPLPWVVKVLVLGAHKDENNQPIPKTAVCTIATGNMQGDIVSRDFLENQLGFQKSSFLELKGTEKRGAVGITGDIMLPKGAINLTWYQKKGSGDFRDMRFLIAPLSGTDIVIGAHSAWKYKLLTAPGLRGENVTTTQVGMSTGRKMRLTLCGKKGYTVFKFDAPDKD